MEEAGGEGSLQVGVMVKAGLDQYKLHPERYVTLPGRVASPEVKVKKEVKGESVFSFHCAAFQSTWPWIEIFSSQPHRSLHRTINWQAQVISCCDLFRDILKREENKKG